MPLFRPLRPRPAAAPRRAGFSLVEVALALTVAAGGMAAIFSLFPNGLRQGINAKRDLVGSSFGGSLLAAISGNVRAIDDIAVWNDPEKWWKAARQDLGLDEWKKGLTAHQFAQGSGGAVQGPNRVAVDDTIGKNADPDEVRYFVLDPLNAKSQRIPAGGRKVSVPAHYIVRVVRVRREPFAKLRIGSDYSRKPTDFEWTDFSGYRSAVATGAVTENEAKNQISRLRRPDRYVVSVVSTDELGFADFHREPAYSQEYFFLHRP